MNNNDTMEKIMKSIMKVIYNFYASTKTSGL